MTTARVSIACIALIVALQSSAPCRAAVDSKTYEFELFGGIYDPGVSALSGEGVFGFRVAYNFSTRLGIYGELGFAQAEEEVRGTFFSPDFELETSYFDAGVEYNFRPRKRVSPAVSGGLGGAFASTDGAVRPEGAVLFQSLSDNSFTLHAGAELKIDISRRFYLRPAARARWIQARDEDPVEFLYTLGLGLTLGR